MSKGVPITFTIIGRRSRTSSPGPSSPAFYYTDFPLVKLADGKIAGIWPGVGVKGSHAFALSGREVLFAGGYENRNRLFLVNLDTSKAQQRIPVDAEGDEIDDFTAFGRGSRLWLQSDSAVFCVDLTKSS